MPAALAVPALISAGGAIGGSLLAKKSVGGSTTPGPGEAAAGAGQTAAGGQLAGLSKGLAGVGMPALKQAGGYFSTLAGGNRAAQTQALAPDIENQNDVYGGTAKTLSRFIRGPGKDVALGEAERERAGGISSLFRNSRPQANAALANMGASATGGAASAAGGAGSIFGQQAERGMQSRFGGAQLEHQAGSDFGGLIFNILKMYSKQGGGGGTGGGGGGVSLPWSNPGQG